jgi:hypothetical protein
VKILTGKRARRERHHRAQADLNEVPTDHAAAVVVLNHGELFAHSEGGVVIDYRQSSIPPFGGMDCHVITALDEMGEASVSGFV